MVPQIQMLEFLRRNQRVIRIRISSSFCSYESCVLDITWLYTKYYHVIQYQTIRFHWRAKVISQVSVLLPLYQTWST